MFSDWKSVELNTYINNDLETSPLLIKTNSELGSLELVKVIFYAENTAQAGGISIHFLANPKFFIHSCKSWSVFQAALPIAIMKEWKISLIKNAAEDLYRVIIHCNDKEVLSYDMSDSTCTSTGWVVWKTDIEKMKFKLNEDNASDFYTFIKVEPFSPGNTYKTFVKKEMTDFHFGNRYRCSSTGCSLYNVPISICHKTVQNKTISLFLMLMVTKIYKVYHTIAQNNHRLTTL